MWQEHLTSHSFSIRVPYELHQVIASFLPFTNRLIFRRCSQRCNEAVLDLFAIEDDESWEAWLQEKREFMKMRQHWQENVRDKLSAEDQAKVDKELQQGLHLHNPILEASHDFRDWLKDILLVRGASTNVFEDHELGTGGNTTEWTKLLLQMLLWPTTAQDAQIITTSLEALEILCIAGEGVKTHRLYVGNGGWSIIKEGEAMITGHHWQAHVHGGKTQQNADVVINVAKLLILVDPDSFNAEFSSYYRCNPRKPSTTHPQDVLLKLLRLQIWEGLAVRSVITWNQDYTWRKKISLPYVKGIGLFSFLYPRTLQRAAREMQKLGFLGSCQTSRFHDPCQGILSITEEGASEDISLLPHEKENQNQWKEERLKWSIGMEEGERGEDDDNDDAEEKNISSTSCVAEETKANVEEQGSTYSVYLFQQGRCSGFNAYFSSKKARWELFALLRFLSPFGFSAWFAKLFTFDMIRRREKGVLQILVSIHPEIVYSIVDAKGRGVMEVAVQSRGLMQGTIEILNEGLKRWETR